MKKRYLICGLIALFWLVKLSYDQMQTMQQVGAVQIQMTQLEQSSANLNDQLVALQRAPSQMAPKKAIELKKNTEQVSLEPELNPLLLVKQQLQLVQFALQQQQEIYAFEQLTQLQKQVSSYAISPALQQSLMQGMSKDLQLIQQYHDLRQTQLDQAHILFKALDQELNLMVHQQKQSYQAASPHFWNRWFKVEPASAPKTELMGQSLVIKEAQIRLLLARQAFDAGLFDEYQQSLKQVKSTLQQAPSFDQTQLLKLLSKAKQLQISPVPSLSSMALVN